MHQSSAGGPFWGPAGVLYRVSYSHKCRVLTLPGDVQNYVQNFLGHVRVPLGVRFGDRLEFCTEFRTVASAAFSFKCSVFTLPGDA